MTNKYRKVWKVVFRQHKQGLKFDKGLGIKIKTLRVKS